MIEIREERREDARAIRLVHEQAFPGPTEANLVDMLRKGNKAPVSVVATDGAKVVGHILFSPVTIDPPVPDIRGLGLAPIAVVPAYQEQGIGAHLIREGLKTCQSRGYDFVVVLGDPHYYSRFGFVPARVYGLGNEYGADEAFMVMELQAGSLRRGHGTVQYHPEFRAAGC